MAKFMKGIIIRIKSMGMGQSQELMGRSMKAIEIVGNSMEKAQCMRQVRLREEDYGRKVSWLNGLNSDY